MKSTFCIAVIGASKEQFTQLSASFEVVESEVQVRALDRFDESDSEQFNAFVIVGDLSKDSMAVSAPETVNVIRESEHGLKPIVTLGFEHPLSDALISSFDETQLERLIPLFYHYTQRNEILSLNAHANLIERLIRYLWLVPERKIAAVKNMGLVEAYHYPLLDLWSPSSTPSQQLAWLNKQEDAQWLSQDANIARTRNCPGCQSALLNFVDCCPSCHSIDIHTERAIHCFTCGHVAAEQEFQFHERLSCKNCHTQLRHIGTDYDRPIENMRCRSCDAMSIDGQVKVFCLSCDHEYEQHSLVTNNYFSFALGDRGAEKAQYGTVTQKLAESLDAPLDLERFAWQTAWLIEPTNALSQAHDKNSVSKHYCLKFTVAGDAHFVRGNSEPALLDFYNEFLTRLASHLNTSVVRCNVDDTLWLFLLPNYDEADVEKLKNTIESISQDALDSPIEILATFYELSDKGGLAETRTWLSSTAEQELVSTVETKG